MGVGVMDTECLYLALVQLRVASRCWLILRRSFSSSELLRAVTARPPAPPAVPRLQLLQPERSQTVELQESEVDVSTVCGFIELWIK